MNSVSLIRKGLYVGTLLAAQNEVVYLVNW